MNLPNAITLCRIVLVPVFLVLAYHGGTGTTAAALVVFVVASVSDYIDGALARRSATVSRLGEWLDPAADKLLVGAALVVLVDLRPFPLWAALVIAVREAGVAWLRTRIVASGGTLPASVIAKAKTVVQMAMVSWWMIPWEKVNAGHWILLTVVLIATLWSGLEYLRKANQVSEAVA